MRSVQDPSDARRIHHAAMSSVCNSESTVRQSIVTSFLAMEAASVPTCPTVSLWSIDYFFLLAELILVCILYLARVYSYYLSCVYYLYV